MQQAPIPHNEQLRLAELYNYDILNTQYEEDFDEVVQLASQICNVPISLISLIDSDRQWFKATTGFNARESGRDVSFCAHAILDSELFVVEDAWEDNRFRDNPLVMNDPSIRFYAGMPLVSQNGFKLGTLCVIDRMPRQLNDEQLFAMKVLSKQVVKLFELRLKNREKLELSIVLENQKVRLEELNKVQNKVISIISHDIRSPLTSLKQVIDLKDMKVIDQRQVSDLMVTINTQIDGTIDMLGNLVDWSSLLINKTEIEHQPINLYNLAAESLDSIVIAALFKNNLLVNTIAKKYLCVTSDANILKFIFRNIIANANKFTANGTITIDAVTTDETVLITIKDTGTGMSHEVLSKLFVSGKYNSTAGTNNEKGNGLGLFLVKDFIDKIGSKLQINSDLGKGTIISFTLPIA